MRRRYPKVGEVWIAWKHHDRRLYWRYQILSIIQHAGKRFYVAAKDNGDEPFLVLFDEKLDAFEDYAEGQYLAEPSRAKMIFEIE